MAALIRDSTFPKQLSWGNCFEPPIVRKNFQHC